MHKQDRESVDGERHRRFSAKAVAVGVTVGVAIGAGGVIVAMHNPVVLAAVVGLILV